MVKQHTWERIGTQSQPLGFSDPAPYLSKWRLFCALVSLSLALVSFFIAPLPGRASPWPRSSLSESCFSCPLSKPGQYALCQVKGSQVQQVGIPSISLQSQGSTLLWPLGFQFRSLLIFYWILIPIYSHEPNQEQNISSTSLQSRIHNIVAIRVSVHKPFFLFLHSHSHLLRWAKPRTRRQRQRQRIWYHLWSRRRFERIER
jgi:hypothetical protein